MRTVLLGLLLMATACRRPSTQFAAMLTPANQVDITDYSKQLKAGDELIAMGNNPAWSLTINSSKGVLRFKALAGDSVNTAPPERQTDSDGVFRYSVGTAPSRLNIVFRPDSCVDKLSGQRFDYRVEVDFRGKSYVGCGSSLLQLTLLNDIWVLTDFQGSPITATDNRKEVPRLEISLSENRVTGTTGCNRLSGSVKADTRQILFGPLVTTKMACLDDANQLESKFLNILANPLTYRVSNGRLTFMQNGKAVMQLKKVD
ncbi:META domain-containing protein [Spirosoma pollinicola]|uniref:META domain-containing protein n=1 Tax=Spirosoma pollinicola TaxID=2057025 RepID=A0A2K8YW76_9BACT|nr:META domain-containing protein [Spirosoma pollinicola]AUD01853.1 META domain-containing protein [Spirosoma pollinicola]